MRGSRRQDVENLIENWLDRVYWQKCSIPFIVSAETEQV